MRKLLTCAAVIAGSASASGAFAQSSVTLYGIVDVAAVHADNVGGHSQTQELSGVFNGDRFGFKGDENLGGGWHAIFQLEDGFNLNNGAFGQGTSASGSTAAVTRMFGRMAWVGLKTPWAKVTMGRQYDFMHDLSPVSASNYNTTLMHRPGTAGTLLGNNGSTTDFDRIGGGRVDNSVKVTSDSIDGFTLGGLYGFGGEAGAFSNGSTQSVGARYAHGALLVSADWTNLKEANASGSYRTYGGGARYRIGPVDLHALYTNAQWSTTGDRVDTLEFGAQYRFTPSFSIAASYFYSKPNNGHSNVILKGTRNQVGVLANYLFSKSTSIYATVNYQRAEHGYAAQIYSLSPTDAGTNHQTVLAVGIQHRF